MRKKIENKLLELSMEFFPIFWLYFGFNLDFEAVTKLTTIAWCTPQS